MTRASGGGGGGGNMHPLSGGGGGGGSNGKDPINVQKTRPSFQFNFDRSVRQALVALFSHSDFSESPQQPRLL